MVEEIAKQAIRIKCGFDNAKLTGNYECAYALGILSGAAGIEKISEYDNLLDLSSKVHEKTKNFVTEDERLGKMITLLKDYEITDIFDEQMKDLYNMGYDDKKI